MNNDVSRLGWGFPRTVTRYHFGCWLRHAGRAALTVAALLALLATVACGEEDNGVTYAEDVKPLFDGRCTTCHYPGGPSVDIQNPFEPGMGLVTSKSLWKMGQPEVDSPEFNVLAGDPDNSFLIRKISDPALGLLPPEYAAGAPMPLQIPPLTPKELAALEQWVQEGAEDTAFFRSNVVPILGSPSSPGKCVHCHYPGTPNPPDLTDLFGNNGVVDIAARDRPDLVRVKPGDPDSSLLILKVRLDPGTDDSPVGAPMPFSFEPLSESEVNIVRQWIIEGARP